MIGTHRGASPAISPTAYVAPTASVGGDVTVGEGAVILSGAVVTAEGGSVAIGRHSIIMEHAVVRGTPGHPCTIGDHVLVGPHAHLSGCVVEDLSFLATGATVLNGAHVGRLADVRVHAVIHVRTRLPPGTTVPINWVAVGDPAQVLPPGEHERIWAVQQTLGFRDAAFLMGDLPREDFMETMTIRYGRALAEHRHDVEVAPPGRKG